MSWLPRTSGSSPASLPGPVIPGWHHRRRRNGGQGGFVLPARETGRRAVRDLALYEQLIRYGVEKADELRNRRLPEGRAPGF